MTLPPASVPAPVWAAVCDLKRRVLQRFGDRLAHVRLFGSYARGQQHEESDVDVLVVIDGLEPVECSDVYEASSDVFYASEIRVATLALSSAEWQHLQDRELLIATDIVRDGIPA